MLSGSHGWAVCQVCGNEFEVGERRKYCSKQCMEKANRDKTCERLKKAYKEKSKEKRKKKVKKKAGYKKPKRYQNELARVAVAARGHGMTYGQYVGVYEYQKGMRI